MKIIGIGNRATLDFTKYVISFFENKDSECIELNEFKKEITTATDKIKDAPFIIIALAIDDLNSWFSNMTDLSIFKDTAFLLLFPSENRPSNSVEIEGISSEFSKYDAEILDTFQLPNFNSNFNIENGISDVKLSLELIRKINSIKQNKFSTYFKKRPSTCGIDNTNFENCDASSY